MAMQDELFTGDEKPGDLLAAVSSIFDQVGIEMKTVLNVRQVVALSVALVFAEKYNIDLLTKLCETLMQLKVSDKGTGRKDLRAVLTTRFNQRREGQEMRDKLIGRRM